MSFLSSAFHSGIHHIIHGARSAINKIHHEGEIIVSGSENDWYKLKHRITELENRVVHLQALHDALVKEEQHLATDASDLAGKVQDEAGKLVDGLTDFYISLKEKIDGLKKDAKMMEELAVVVSEHAEEVLKAIENMVHYMKKEGLEVLIDIKRLTRLWQVVRYIYDDAVRIITLTLQTVDETAKLTDYALQQIEAGWNAAEPKSSQTIAGDLQTVLNNTLSFCELSKFPAALQTDLKNAASLIEQIGNVESNVLLHKATAHLNLDYLTVTINERLKEIVDHWDTYQNKHDVMLLLKALTDTCKSAISQSLKLFGADVDVALLDYLKAKIGGGEDSGTVAGDADASSGGGGTFGIDAFSFSGALGSIVMAIVSTLSAALHLFLDLRALENA